VEARSAQGPWRKADAGSRQTTAPESSGRAYDLLLLDPAIGHFSLDVGEQRGGHEDRGERADDEADEQRDREVLERVATEDGRARHRMNIAPRPVLTVRGMVSTAACVWRVS
jgi:hypothetical protein